MIKHVFICDYEDYVRDAITVSGTTSFDVVDGSMWGNCLTISGLGVGRTISSVVGNTVTVGSAFTEALQPPAEVHSGDRVCTYSELYDKSGPDSLYTTICRKKNCSGYLAPTEAMASTPIFKVETTDTPNTVKSYGCDYYRFGFYGSTPSISGIYSSGDNTWNADSTTGLVSNLVSEYVGDGVPLGLPALEKFAQVWKGKFYARHTGTVTFQFIGNGHFKFDFNDINRKDADIAYDTYDTWTSASLTAGTFYNFRAEFYTTTREEVGFVVNWKSNASGAFPDYLPLSAGAMIRTSDSDFKSSYSLPDVTDCNPDWRKGQISEFKFTVPLVKNNNTVSAGYYRDTATGVYKHASWDSSGDTFKYQAADSNYTLKKFNMIEYHEGYQSRAGTHDYVQKFSGHIIDFEPSREPGNDRLVIICRDFGQLLKDSFSENHPTRRDYWMMGYGDLSVTETNPEGIKAPAAWDGWELRKFFMSSLINAGIDPVLFDRKRRAFDKDYVVSESIDWEVTIPSLTVYLDRNINYGNPEAVGASDGTSESGTVDDSYNFKYDYGQPWIDIVDDVTGQYLYEWGFRAEGYPWLGGRLIPSNIAYVDNISLSGTGW